MAHELDVLANGELAYVGVESAWHKEGTVIPDGISYNQAIEHGGLDFEVNKVQNYIKSYSKPDSWLDPHDEFWAPESHAVYVEAPNSFSVVRSDRTGKDSIIGNVGRVWQPLQNRDGFGVLEPLVDDGILRIETAGSLRGGSQVWMLVQFDKQRILAQAEEWLAKNPNIDRNTAMATLHELIGEVSPFALVTNDHSGKAMARIFETWVRVVCANTMQQAFDSDQEGLSLAVSHTSNVTSNFKEGSRIIFQNMAQRYAEFAGQRDLLKKTRLPSDITYSTSPFRKFVLDACVPVFQLEEKIRRREGTGHTRSALDRAHQKRAEITRLWTSGKGHTGDHSAWEAWQGVIQYYDHESKLKSKNSSRIDSLYGGSLGQIKKKVGFNLATYADNQRSAILN